jgi:hypothetical protein
VFAQRESEVLLAHTSPVYVHAGGAAIASAADAAFFRDWVDRLMREVREEGVFDGDGQRREVLDLFARARQIYARTAGETGPARAAGAEYR